MKTSASLNCVMQIATESRCCQAKGCPKLGTPRSIVDSFGDLKWTYFMCDEHVRFLSDGDKECIAFTEGTISE